MFGIHHLPLFMLSGLLLNILPGPDSLLVLTRSTSQGWRAGCAAAFGIGAGTMVHVSAAAIGLSAVHAAPAAFGAVKYAGAAYIFYTATCLIRRAPRDAAAAVAVAPMPYRRIAAQGFLTDVLNPKGALFFISFVPQFIEAGAPGKPLALLVLGCIFNLNGVLWYVVLAVAATKLRERIRPTPLMARWLARATGAMFVWIGVKLAFAEQ